jgi:hypothetical protein
MSNILDSLMKDFIVMAEGVKKSEGLWREEPVDLLTFFKSKDYLGETPYAGKQTELLTVVNQVLWWKLTKEEKYCPESLQKVTEVVAMLGKGSGKDFLASGILAYVCYLLCCMNDPHTYFGFAQDEPIDLINVAINANQATNVFFKKLKARLNSCKWFKRVTYNPAEYPGSTPTDFQFTKSQIRFYKNITAHSAHSEADSFEGFNPLIVIFDEIGGYELDKAEECYKTLRSSAVSRYNERVLLIFISFPRSMGDYMMKKYNEATKTKDPQVYAMRGKSWEVNPKISRESFNKDYITDPEGSRMKYECIPPEYTDGLFQFPDRIDQCVEIGKTSQCPGLLVQEKICTRTLHTGEERHFVGLEIYNLNLDPSYTYYLGGDGGVTTDSYILALFHAEAVTIETVENNEVVLKTFNKPVEDVIFEWRPSKKDRLPVDLINVADVIEMICKQVFIKKALFDKFNSAEVVQRLMVYGVEAEDKNWSNPFQLQLYTNFKTLIYTSQVSLLDYRSVYEGIYPDLVPPNEEIKALKIINGNKIDHDVGKSKDFSDARVAACWICSMDEPTEMTHCAMPSILGAKTKK